MLRKFTLLFLILAPVFLFSQITIVSTDLSAVGDTFTRHTDTTSGFGPGSSGMNQIWDFRNALHQETADTWSVDPATTPYAASYPTSTQALTSDGDAFLYVTLGAANATLDGAAGDFLGVGLVVDAPFSPVRVTRTFPATHTTAFTDVSGFDITIDGAPFAGIGPIDPDSVRLDHGSTVYDTIDGYGTIITPDGMFECLRVTTIDMTTDELFALAGFFPFPPTWTSVADLSDTVTTVSYLAKETGLAIAEITFDSLGNPANFVYTHVPSAPTIFFTTTDLTMANYSFTDESLGTPTSWAWDFGDGTTSTDENPVHSYTTNGTFVICLTVTNALGSDSACDTVLVEEAPEAEFTNALVAGGLFDFTDISTFSPDTWAWDFGDGGTSTDQNPSYEFTANASYEVCLTASNAFGTDTWCDSVTVTDYVGIREDLQGPGLTAYPNPTQHKLTLAPEAGFLSGSYTLYVIDEMGRKVSESVVNVSAASKVEINTSTFPNGIFHYVMTHNQKGSTATGKFVVIK